MRIDKKLNLVVPVQTERGEILVHSQPIATATFKRHFLAISKTFAMIHNEGLGISAGPRVAAMMLARVEADLAGADKAADPQESLLLQEVRRLTNAIVPGPQGAETIPWQQVIDGKMIDEEDIDEVENSIVFFIVGSAMYNRADRTAMLTGAAKLWDARLESSSSTELADSLRTSKGTEITGAKATGSSIPR